MEKCYRGASCPSFISRMPTWQWHFIKKNLKPKSRVRGRKTISPQKFSPLSLSLETSRPKPFLSQLSHRPASDQQTGFLDDPPIGRPSSHCQTQQTGPPTTHPPSSVGPSTDRSPRFDADIALSIEPCRPAHRSAPRSTPSSLTDRPSQLSLSRILSIVL
jgi:hypothetical protein